MAFVFADEAPQKASKFVFEDEEAPRANTPMPKEPSQVDVWLEKLQGMGKAFGVAPEPDQAPDMEPMGTQAMAPAVDLRSLLPKDYGQREDGTAKGKGWLGEIPMQDGRVMTEMSIGVSFDGKEELIPAIVPTLTKDELSHLANGGKVTDSIADKAVEHAKMRIRAGLSPFVDEKPAPDNPDMSGDPGTMQISPAEQLRSLLGTGEAAANLATVPVGLAVGGGRALLEAAKGSDLQTIAAEARKKAEEFTYSPRTEAGQQIAGAAMAPFEKLSEFDDALAQKVYDNTGNAFIAAMMGSAPELLLAGAPFISRLKLGRQGMAKGSITPEEMTAGMTEGQRLRNLAKEYGPDSPEFKAAFEDSLGKRMGTQEPIAPEAPAAPVQAAPPVEPVVAPPAVRSPEVAPVAAPAAVVPPVVAPVAPESSPVKIFRGVPKTGTGLTGVSWSMEKNVAENWAASHHDDGGKVVEAQLPANAKIKIFAEKDPELGWVLNKDGDALFHPDEYAPSWENAKLDASDEETLSESLKKQGYDAFIWADEGGSEVVVLNKNAILPSTAGPQPPALPETPPMAPPAARPGAEVIPFPQQAAPVAPAEAPRPPVMPEAPKVALPEPEAPVSSESLQNDAQMMKDEQEWTKAVETKGSRVVVDTPQGKVFGEVVQPRKEINGTDYVLVRHPFEGQPADRWYNVLKVSPAKPSEVVKPMPEARPGDSVEVRVSDLEKAEAKPKEPELKLKGEKVGAKEALSAQRKMKSAASASAGVEAMPAGNVQPQGPTQPAVFSKPIPKGQKRSETIKAVEKKLGLPIRFGKFRGPFAGIYKKKAEVVRLKKANDIGVAAHEVAHHVQDLIGLGGTMPPEVQAMAYAGAKNLDREGFAEFVRYYITDMPKVQREAPGFMATFDAALDQHPDVADAFTRIKESWNAWQAADPVQKIASIIRRGKDDKQRYTLNELYRDWVDELHPVQLLSDAIQKRSPNALAAIDDPYIMAWLTRGWARKAEQMLKYGTFQMDEAKGVKFTGKSLREILKPIERAGEMEEIDVYLVSKRAMNDERILKGFEGVLPGENFVQAVERLEPKYGEIAKDLYKFQDEVLKYLTKSGRISQEMADSYRDQNAFYAPLYRVMDDMPPSGRIGAGKYSEIGNPAKRLKGSSRDILSPVENIIKNTFAFVNAAERNRVGQAILKATEVQGMGDMVERIPFPLEPQKILKEDFLRLLKQYGDVTAIRNVQITQTQTERALGQMGAQASPSTKLIKVAKEALERRGFSPAEADQIIERIKAAPVGQARQDVIEKTVEKTVIMTIKEELGFGRMPDQVLHTFRPAYRAGPSEAIFYDDGKPVLVEMSKELASAVKGMDADGVNLLVKILALPAKVLRAGATVTPEFAARNPIRDQMTAFIFSKYGYIPGWDLVRGIYHILKVDDLYKKYNASGGAQAALVSLDRNYLSLKLEELQRMQTPGEAALHPLKTAKNLIIASAKNPLKVLQIFSELTEEASRVGGFTRALKTEGVDLEALLRAAVEGRDMTLDFSRVGAKSRAMNMITAFFNANIQGTNKMYRAFKERPGQTFAKAFFGITVPSLLLYYAQHDDPYYDEIPLWRKLIFWNIITHKEDGSLNHIWSIPKPFEVGILFGTVPIMALEWMKTHDPKAFKEAMIAAGQALLPGVVPTAALPWVENFANRSLFFDRPISPRGSEDLSPWLQYSERTSEAMKLAAKGLKDVPFLKEYANPAKMENVVRGYTGGMGGYALQEIDRILKATGAVTVAPAPAMKLEDLPLIKGFSQRWPTANAQSIEDFYEKYMEAKRKWADRQETVGINRARDVFSARGERLTLKSGEKVALGMPPELESMEGVAKMLTVLRNNAKVTKASQTATPDQKTEQLDRIYLAMTNLARKALGKQQLK